MPYCEGTLQSMELQEKKKVRWKASRKSVYRRPNENSVF